MKALADNKRSVNKLLCLVLSFTLAFSMLGTPAFASEAQDQTPDAPQISQDAQTDPIAAPQASEPVAVITPAADPGEPPAPAEDPQEEGTQETGEDAPQVLPASEQTTGDVNPEDEGSIEEERPRDDIQEGTHFDVKLDTSYAPAEGDRALAYCGITVENQGSVDLSDVQLDVSMSNPFMLEGGAQFAIDKPVVSVPAASSKWFTSEYASVSISIPYSEETRTLDITVTATCGDQSVTKTTSMVIDQQRTAAYELSSSYVIYNQDGAMRTNGPVTTGDVIEYTYTLSNVGSTILHGVQARTEFELSPATDVEDEIVAWPDEQDVAEGQVVTYVGRYAVTDADAAAKRNLQCHAYFLIDGKEVSTSPDPLKAVERIDYSIFYYVDFGDGNPQFVAACKELTAPLGTYVEVAPGTALGQLDYLFSPEAYDDIYAYLYGTEYLEGFDLTGFEAVAQGIVIESSDVADNVIEVVYSKKVNFAYTINYYKDSASPENLLNADAPVRGKALVGSECAVEASQLNIFLPEGYKPLEEGQSPSIVISEDESSNVIDVVYEQRNSYGYRIEYYVDSVDPANLLYDATRPEAYEGTAEYGQLVALSEAQLKLHLPRGYAELQSGDVDSLVISTDEAKNVIQVVYTQKATYTYIINYYYGVMGDTPAYVDQSRSAEYGSVVTIDEDMANLHLMLGYERAEAVTLDISDDAKSNVVNIVYPKRTDIPYTINYYVDSADEQSFVESVTREATFEDIVTIDADELNAHLPAVGYIAKTMPQTLVISADADRNVIDVVYERDSFSYTIEYYKKEIIQNRDITTYLGSYTPDQKQQYGTVVSLDVDTLNSRFPGTGYIRKGDGDIDSITVSADEASNKLVVTYELESYEHTVNYYIDSVSDDNLIDSITGKSKYGTILMYHSTVVNAFKPAGYADIDGTKYLPVTDDPSNNVLNIIYTERQSGLSYQIKYYCDSISDENLRSSIVGIGAFGDRIPYALYAGLPDGYDPNPAIITGSSIIGASIDDSTMSVVYKKASYGYTVNYYVDSVDEGNLLGSTSGAAVHGSIITHTPGLYAPEGYDPDVVALSGSSMISSDAQKNVLNVVYTRVASIPYVVKYYAGSTSGDLLGQYSGNGAVGDVIPYDESHAVPQGYSHEAQLSGTANITKDPAQNVLNVVFPAISYSYAVNYYRDELDPANFITQDTGIAPYREAIPFVNGAHVPTGYDPEGLLDGPTTVQFDESLNVLNVIYKPARFTYTINYYRGVISSATLINSVVQPAHPYNTTVEIPAAELNYYMEEGYARLTEGTSLTISADPAQNVVNVVFAPDFRSFYSTDVTPLRATYNGSKHYLDAPKGLIAGDIVTYAYEGGVQRRIVGVDANVAAEFEEVTNGDVPVSITVTRSNITSDALVSSVNITPALAEEPPAPGNPAAPNDSGSGINPAPAQETPSQSATPASDRSPLASVAAASFAPVLATADNATTGGSSYSNMAGGVIAGSVIDALQSAISDDGTPLSNLAAQGLGLQAQQDVAGIIGLLLLVLSMLCLGISLILLIKRKRMLECTIVLKGESLAVARAKAKTLLYSCAFTAIFSASFFLLWLLLRI